MNDAVREAAPRSPVSRPEPGDSATPLLPRPPSFFELGGQGSWFVRGQNFGIGYTWLIAGGNLSEVDIPDEHILLVPEETSVRISRREADSVSVDGAAVVIVPPGASRVVADTAGALVRVFSARSAHVLARACNSAVYAEPDPAVRPLPPETPEPGPGTLRVHPLADVADDPGRFGRIFRSDSLMINWFRPEYGPRDTDRLSPHAHDHFEQASLTLAGEYVHHLRRPWTARLQDWRPDQHVQCSSPSVAIIPPGNIHTTRALGEGVHHLVDVFAPPREDFLQRVWVLNAADYAVPAPTPLASGGAR